MLLSIPRSFPSAAGPSLPDPASVVVSPELFIISSLVLVSFRSTLGAGIRLRVALFGLLSTDPSRKNASITDSLPDLVRRRELLRSHRSPPPNGPLPAAVAS